MSNELDRRVFVKGVGYVSLGLVLGFMGGCEDWAKKIANRPVRRRLRTGSADVDADIATYKAGVTAMKALDTSNPADPRGWAKQAAIHGVGCCFNFCEHGTPHFFDWHRGYLFYFEKIIQKLTGKPQWGLPYWNWNQDPAIHPAFLDTSGPLFLPRTRTSMSGSWSITTPALDPIFADTNFFSFGTQIEGTPHNNVHGYIGGTMGTGGSASDPLFWAHHNMVDYCWAKWNIELGNSNTNDATWINHVNSHFVDADGNVATATAIATVLMPLLSYQYESSAIGSSPAKVVVKTKEDFQRVEKWLRQGAAIKFDIKRRVPIVEKVAMSIARPVSLESTAEAPQFDAAITSNDEKVFVSIDYAQLPPETDFVVRVFLNLPNANRDTPTEDPHHAGSFSFFGTEPPPGSNAHRHRPQFLVNATETLRRLRQNQMLKNDTPITVQLVPVPFPGDTVKENAQLTIEQLQLIVTPVIIKSPPQ
jgi:tyrosinase